MTITGLNSSPPTPTTPRDVASAGTLPEAPAHKKLRKAAREFEGMLISQLLGDFHLSALGGDAPMAGSDTLNSLAIQTLSTALAARGGLGIARMLVHQLEPSLNRGEQKPSYPQR